MRWVAIGACLGLAAGCGGLGPAQLTASMVRTDAGAAGAANDLAGAPAGGLGGSGAGGGPASDAGAPANDAGVGNTDTGVPACPPAQPDPGLAFPPATWAPATAGPFSCDPLPNAFFFPRPGGDVPGAYARCASFGGGRATALAVNPDGTRVAMIADDGIVRLIDVASHMVVGVLAPPRASIDRAAFSPAGDTIVTMAKGERVVTLWRADTLAPVWSVTLPGHTYFKRYIGGLTFSPDGGTVLVSPGADVFLLDVLTGAIRATRNQGTSDSSVLAAVYGWNGRRIVVQEAPVSGMCVQLAVAGSVTILDPDTLAPIATPMSWPQLSDEGPPPGDLAVAAAADLMLTTGAYPDTSIKAFRVSDGSPLPPPDLDAFPLLLTPDGTAGLIVSSDVRLQNLTNGSVIASAASAPTVVAASADGATVALGSSGSDLLSIWRRASGAVTPTCSALPSPPRDSGVQLAVSADAQTVALRTPAAIRVMRRADGATLSTITQGDRQVGSVSLSPDGHEAVAEFFNETGAFDITWGLFRTSDGSLVTTLGCGTTAFSPDETTLTTFCDAGGSTVTQVETATGAPVPHACNVPTLSPFNGIVSLDGTALLSADSGELAGSTLWQLTPTRQVVQQYPPRPEESAWQASEIPVAVSTHAERVITGARNNAPCNYTPQFTSRVYDVATGAIVDELPPSPASTSADLSVLAYGTVLWCQR